METNWVCNVDGCAKPGVKGYKKPICGMHRSRIIVHGSTDDPRKPRKERLEICGYWHIYMPDHPLKSHKGYIGEHRVVLYAKIGPGVHPCHWCKKPLEWVGETRWDGIYVDHLDRDRKHNVPSNVVPSCNQCNIHRHDLERTACDKGHAYTEENTYRYGNKRKCRTCTNARQRMYGARKRAAAKLLTESNGGE